MDHRGIRENQIAFNIINVLQKETKGKSVRTVLSFFRKTKLEKKNGRNTTERNFDPYSISVGGGNEHLLLFVNSHETPSPGILEDRKRRFCGA